MKTAYAIGISALLVAGLGMAQAGTQAYVNAAAVGDHYVICDPDVTGLCFGGAILAAGTVTANSAGQATLTIDDDNVNPASGLLRQSSDALFCGSHTWTLESGDVIVFVDGVAFGNPATSPCGSVSVATVGELIYS